MNRSPTTTPANRPRHFAGVNHRIAVDVSREPLIDLEGGPAAMLARE